MLFFAFLHSVQRGGEGDSFQLGILSRTTLGETPWFSVLLCVAESVAILRTAANFQESFAIGINTSYRGVVPIVWQIGMLDCFVILPRPARREQLLIGCGSL